MISPAESTSEDRALTLPDSKWADQSIEIAPARSNKVSKAVRRALDDQSRRAAVRLDQHRIKSNGHIELPAMSPEEADNVIRPLPRRKQPKTTNITKDLGPPPLKFGTSFNASNLDTFKRLLVWIRTILTFFGGTLIDVLRRRDSEDRRAVRLRRTLESAGGTLLKIGQQMAIRLDLLPLRYCEELSKMLDNVPPFPTKQAIQAIEIAIGGPLSQVFSAFDPEPIGSASIACVYQAVMRNTGEKVAIKVRRPNIQKTFAGDFRVLDWMMGIAEALTLLRPGFSVNIRAEFRTALGGELDFRREARFQEIFGRRSRKVKTHLFGAPGLYPQYCSEDVLVEEFVSGMWLWEVLSAVEQQDATALARMRELNIDPELVAKRLLYALYWGLHDHIAFHADPHPANIVVRANSELIFIDFGACGWLDYSRRLMYQRSFAAQARGNVWGMVQAALAIVEPLPPMDINAIAKEIEAAYYEHLLAFKSKHSKWYERTSAATWIATLSIINKYKIPAPLDTLLFARATLLYDTLAARLYPKIDFYKEFARFSKDMHKKARKRSVSAIQQRMRKGFTDSDYELFEKIADTGNGLLYRVQRLLLAPYDFALLPFAVEKWIYAATTLTKLLVRTAIIAVAGVGIVSFVNWMTGQQFQLQEVVKQVVLSPLFLLAVTVLVLLHIRLVLFRLEDKTRIH